MAKRGVLTDDVLVLGGCSGNGVLQKALEHGLLVGYVEKGESVWS